MADSFTEHIQEVAERASTAAMAVGRLMPNIDGPSFAKRTLLQSVVSSRLLYVAPVWAERAVQFACNQEAMGRAQRLSALRVIRGYRTISGAAALVLADSLPADLLALERAELYRKATFSRDVEVRSGMEKLARERSICEWQRRWASNTVTAGWTRRVIPDIGL